MLLLDGIILGLIGGLVSRGRLNNLTHAKLKGEIALVAILVFQMSVPRLATMFGLTGSIPLVAWLLSMVALVVLALVNWRSAGMVLAALGVTLNIFAIALNGAMPVSMEAIAAIDSSATPRFDLLHEPVTDETRLVGLTDVVALPGPTWHRGVASIGDFFLTLGAGLYVFVAMHEKRSTGV